MNHFALGSLTSSVTNDFLFTYRGASFVVHRLPPICFFNQGFCTLVILLVGVRFKNLIMTTSFWTCASSFRIALKLSIILAVSTVSLHADLLVYEGFDYPAGDLVGQIGGKGWKEPWHGDANAGSKGAVVGGSLTSPQPIATTGGHMETPDPDTPLERGLEKPLFDKVGVTWMSLLLRNDSGQTDATYSLLMLKSTLGDNKSSMVKIGKEYNSKNWGIGCGDQKQDFGQPATDTAVLIVLRLEHTKTPGGDSIEAFVNPTITSEPASPDARLSGLTLQPADLVSIRSGNDKKLFSYDEIRIGTTYADVVPPAATSPVAAAPADKLK